MAKIDLDYDILQDSPASASPVEANFNRIEQHINQEVIERSGSVSMIGQLQLAGDPQSPLDAASKQYVDLFMPVGIIMMFGGVSAPPGGRWAVCNGAEVESSLYPELFAVISTTYSLEGTPAGRFNLPNLTDRFALGAGTVATLGKQGGSRNPTPSPHSHPNSHNHGGNVGDTSNNHTHTMVDHLHAVNGSTSNDNVFHTHRDAGHGMFVFDGSGGDHQFTVATGSRTLSAAQNTGNENVLHHHDVAFYSGVMVNGVGTPIGAAASGGQSVGHTHPIPTETGRTGVEGTADLDTNLPSFVAVTYIMRVK